MIARGILLLVVIHTMAIATKLARLPTRAECDTNAQDGLCNSRKYEIYMTEYCEVACEDYWRRTRHAALQEEMRRPRPRNPGNVDVDSGDDGEEWDSEDEAALGHHNDVDSEEDNEGDSEDNEDEEGEEEEPPSLHPEFFNLSARDIDNNEIFFSDIRGKISVITNVASECGYTESHYEGMVELYEEFSETEVFNIIAFPCNQFDEQEPGTNAEIKKFAEDLGVKFTMMDKIDVNGPRSHPVYQFLRREVGPPAIEWNFDTYFVVGPDDSIRSFSDIKPEYLKDVIEQLLDQRDEI